MDFQTLRFETRDQVAYITFNRPDAAHGINLELATDLMHAALRCDEDPAIRAVVLSGTGKVFCAGGDLKTFHRQGARLPLYLKEVTTNLHVAISHFLRMEAPIIAAVNGVAAGAGMSLACACDLVVAAESARFTMAYTRAGLVPDGGSTYALSRIVGLRRAMELALTNRVLSAREALEWGIATRVVADPAFAAEVDTLARELASGATLALGAAKRLLHQGWTETLETQMEAESRAIADVARSADAREGIAAFVEKRTPTFRRQ